MSDAREPDRAGVGEGDGVAVAAGETGDAAGDVGLGAAVAARAPAADEDSVGTEAPVLLEVEGVAGARRNAGGLRGRGSRSGSAGLGRRVSGSGGTAPAGGKKDENQGKRCDEKWKYRETVGKKHRVGPPANRVGWLLKPSALWDAGATLAHKLFPASMRGPNTLDFSVTDDTAEMNSA